MVHRSSLVAVIVALALCHASPAYPKCARVLLAPQLITHAADPIPAGGGVLIGFTETTDDSAETFAGHDPAMNADWTLVVGKRKTRPRLEQLAPGLAVYRPGALRGTRPTQVVLRDGKGAKVGAFSASSRADAASLPAPSVKRVTSTAVAQDKGRWRGTVTTTVVEVDQIPDRAAALIAYRQDGNNTTALTWARVAVGSSPAIEIYASPGKCGTEPEGLTAPAPGVTVVLAWVDQFGRRSPLSTPSVVK
ncbi:MAG: hypothetical protein IPH44_19440 [Myxococcales bacterium]|nr:hypothetical protein [Myxococcales bacterium]